MTVFFCQIFNNDLLPVKIPRTAALGHLEIIDKNRLHNVDEKLYLASIEMAVKKDPPPPTVGPIVIKCAI